MNGPLVFPPKALEPSLNAEYLILIQCYCRSIISESSPFSFCTSKNKEKNGPSSMASVCIACSLHCVATSSEHQWRSLSYNHSGPVWAWQFQNHSVGYQFHSIKQ